MSTLERRPVHPTDKVQETGGPGRRSCEPSMSTLERRPVHPTDKLQETGGPGRRCLWMGNSLFLNMDSERSCAGKATATTMGAAVSNEGAMSVQLNDTVIFMAGTRQASCG